MPVVTRVIMSAAKKQFGNRKFYALPEDYSLKTSKFRNASLKKEDTAKLIKYIDDNVIGKNTTFAGPYGRRKVVYCDYAASGRALQFIEDYIMREVLPVYGNTHTTTSITSMQSTLLRHEAKDIIRNAVNASEDDVVIFAGHGCTAAVHKLIHSLALAEPPIVFVGPCEHHSNLLPWREIQAKVVRISETKEGFLDLVDLENQLQLHRQLEGADRQLIGCFSAASNITGILADDVATTLLLHQYNALAFWDYATAAPYVQLDMNPILPGMDEKSVHKDAIFFSGHKFVGGVQTPGVLVAKKELFKNPVPNGCGGGTVFFVRHNSHCYLKDTEMREEGGTAGIVESIRLGIAMQLKQTLGVPAILTREEKITKMVLSHLRNIPEVLVLGNSSLHTARRLAVFALMVRHPRGTFLHHNFVCAVLNDVFGVQARGGCACAGPYAQDLMGIDQQLAAQFEQVLMEDDRLDRRQLRRREEHSAFEMLRPGFTRISLPYFMSDAEVSYVLEAIKMVATEAWKLLPQYILNPETGEWRHHTNSVFKDRKWLGSIRYVDGKMSVHERRISGVAACPIDHNDCLHTARNIFNKARKMAQRYPLADQCVMFDERTSALRWFMLPSEAQDLLLGNVANVKQEVPFTPPEYHGSRGGSSPPTTPTHFARHNSLSALDIRARRTRDRLDSQSPVTLHPSGSSPQIQFNSNGLMMRKRCYSLDSNNKLTPTPRFTKHSANTTTTASSLCSAATASSSATSSPLALLPFSGRQRQISCGSQTDLSQSGNEGDTESRGTTPPTSMSAENAEQIQVGGSDVT
ncbi:uncharacterized protein LOC120353902 [Nilaparvata lugens]|uniref:uncharacterized protein LOC120353902 n=1 Tax=Nilaparvata lugens TaxID=108931 RepID=UPI00193D4953|nr:uncharacterized protein LOC120353902 [Nilaparvata lugens]